MKPTAESGLANISHKEWFETRRCFIAIAFQLCFRVSQWEGSGKPGWFEIIFLLVLMMLIC
jgi:hypothetical protein